MSELSRETQEFFLNLYNGYSGIAEHVKGENVERIHIDTKLQSKIVSWLEAGLDVILTGNPGDGKTHLLRKIQEELDVKGVEIISEADASQYSAEDILSKWVSSKEAHTPFLLAINHAPLRVLAGKAKGHPKLHYLYEGIFPPAGEAYQSEIISFVIYSKEQADYYRQTAKPFMIIDLSWRATLTDTQLVEGLLDKLCSIAAKMTCRDNLPTECTRCPIRYNARALQDEKIRKRLLDIFELLSRRGYRSTVRDLIGFLVYSLTRGVKCDELWKENRSCYQNDYYNLMFDPNARNSLFDALQETFDPGIYADTEVDIKLWNGEIKENWFDKESVPTGPANLPELRSLKRRYFFEGVDSAETQFRRILSNTAIAFDQLFDPTLDIRNEVGRLVEMINLFYAPLSKKGESDRGYQYQLRLWDKHRYAVGGTPSYFAMRVYSTEKLTLYYPELNSKYQQAMPIHRDHILLAVHNWLPGDPALRVDWDMYQALASARDGKPIDVQPYHVLRRLDLFLHQLGNDVSNSAPIETIEWSERRARRVVSLRIDRRSRTFVND